MKRTHLRVLTSLMVQMRTAGKPIIAAVNGYAIGLGNELHMICDISIAADHAKFGQTGPKVSSVPIWACTNMMHRTIGEKRAREMLYFCRQYTAAQALQMGLVNHVVPMAELMTTARAWAEELLDKSPSSLRIAKLAFDVRATRACGAGCLRVVSCWHSTSTARSSSKGRQRGSRSASRFPDLSHAKSSRRQAQLSGGPASIGTSSGQFGHQLNSGEDDLVSKIQNRDAAGAGAFVMDRKPIAGQRYVTDLGARGQSELCAGDCASRAGRRGDALRRPLVGEIDDAADDGQHAEHDHDVHGDHCNLQGADAWAVGHRRRGRIAHC